MWRALRVTTEAIRFNQVQRVTQYRYSKPLKFSSLMMKFTSIPLYLQKLDSEMNIKKAFLETHERRRHTRDPTGYRPIWT